MLHVHNFTFGLITPAMAYLMSVVGSSLGLICARRARQVTDPWVKLRWIFLSAVTIGGAGIWLMHFLAMIGFTVEGTDIRYNIFWTAASAVIAIAVVGLGLLVVTTGERSFARLLLAGTFTGLGVAAMHYSGMTAMKVSATVHYDSTLVLLSVVIAVVASTVALWFALVVRGAAATSVAALIMGLAVAGMHYTGMAAVSVQQADALAQGVELIRILIPVFIVACFVLIVPLYVFLALDAKDDALPEGG